MSSFVCETHLNIRPYQYHVINRSFKYAHIIYLRLLSLEKRKLDEFDKIDKVIELRGKLKVVKDAKKKKAIQSVLSSFRKQCNLRRFDIINDVKEFYKPYKEYITSQMAQSIAKRVDASVSDYVENLDVEFNVNRIVRSIESESTTNGIKFDGSNVIFKDMLLPIKVRKDSYFHKAIANCELKYIRLVKRIGKTKPYIIAQFIFKGDAIAKSNIKVGNGDVGIDIGTSTIAYCSNDDVKIEEFSKELVKTDEKISLINKQLDKIRRTNNPENFNDNGTIKKKEERVPWKRTNHYKKLLQKLRYLKVKFTNQRKNLYEHQVNDLISKGNRFIIEPMDYAKLAKKEKETKKDENGRFLDKSRYGKSLLNHAPSTFIGILERKLGYFNIALEKVNSTTFKASQYDHVKDEYIKCDLDVRIKDIGGHKVQRDLYSAFLLMNAADDLKETDKQKCSERFEKFLSLHEIEIQRLQSQKNISCIGI